MSDVLGGGSPAGRSPAAPWLSHGEVLLPKAKHLAAAGLRKWQRVSGGAER